MCILKNALQINVNWTVKWPWQLTAGTEVEDCVGSSNHLRKELKITFLPCPLLSYQREPKQGILNLYVLVAYEMKRQRVIPLIW